MIQALISSKFNLKYVYMLGLLSIITATTLFTYGYVKSDIWLMNNKFEVKSEEGRLKTIFCNLKAHYILPDATVVNKMDIETLYYTFAGYIRTKQIQCCNVSRAGPTNNFGKNICLDNFKKLKHDCLVYSFGSQFSFEFENAIWRSYRCEIHTFDPSHSTKDVHIPAGVNFHLIGLSNTDEPMFIGERKWRMRTLSSIMKYLKHTKRFIDILKIDIEGWEWKALPEIFHSGVLRNVNQLCLEVHFGYSFHTFLKNNRTLSYRHVNKTWGNVSIQNQLQTLKTLYEHGFRIFKSDPIRNWGAYHLKRSKKKIDSLIEISLVNINYQ